MGFRKWKNGDAVALRGVNKWLKTFQRKNKNGIIWGSLCPLDLINEGRRLSEKNLHRTGIFFLNDKLTLLCLVLH